MRSGRADDLLKKLGSGVRPSGGVTDGGGALGPDFQGLLRAARSGELASGRSVRVRADLGLELTGEEQEDLDRAADAAEAAGASSLLAVIEGAAVRVDVPGREAVEARPLRVGEDEGAEVMTGIDAAVVLVREREGGSGSEDGEAERDTRRERLAPGLRIGPPGRIASASLWRRLAETEHRGD